MKTVSRIGAFAAGAALVLAAQAYAASPAVTIGSFLEKIAAARHLPAATAQDAVRSLRNAGVAIPNLDVNATLTEGSVVAIGNALGVTVTTRSPEAPFDQAHVDSFLQAFGPQIGGSDTPSTRDQGGSPNPNSDNGKGKKKGHNKSTSEPGAPSH